ncbi:hypothetical protein O181_007406 [Austropuccinia psidii MF-1]|uniref:Uncharacterized protein n=1 Tax=Austropuccinia psidii MF-1 TaxID=1389203 RepID=A0A9Q3BMR5_9BASI|nr:hypothetical protein [Austropuccinia psidii MF-1]
MGWQISPLRGMELCASSEIGKWSIDKVKSSKRKKAEETETQSSTRMKKIFLGTNSIPFSAIFDAKNELNIIAWKIAMIAELNISPYTVKSPDNSLKPIGQIKSLEVTSFNKENMYRDFLVFDNFNQIVVQENPSISSSSKESIPHAPDRKSK